MNTSLSYLPQIKQDQILQVIVIIKEVANPEKIILFGSYATGNWVDDKYFKNGTHYDYISDFDFLVVTKNAEEKEFVLKDKIVNKTRPLFKTPVNIIIHSLEYVNEGLEIGQYFFSDIISDGILLFESNNTPFSQARQLTVTEKKEIAIQYFEKWSTRGNAFFKTAKFSFEEKDYNLATFLLHQAAEKYYNTILLVYTGYKPKTHNLDILRQYTKPLSKELFTIFPYPSDDKEEEHLFDLLKYGYIDARYKDEFQISEDELINLISRVDRLREVVLKSCNAKIKSFI